MPPEDFTDQLRSLGLNTGDAVLMHSSMKALGTQKTPLEFINDIITVLGPEGTLLVPALSYKYVTDERPYFSVAETEPCIGLIPVTFFHMEGTVRSIHPTHSVCAIGRHAREIISRHFFDETPVGPNSPFMKLPEYGGKLLFIGNILKSCTFMHGVEEIAGTPYTLKKEKTRYFIKDRDGHVSEKDMYGHDFTGWNQEYQRIRDILQYPDIKTGKIGQADCFLINSAVLKEKALEKFREDPLYFVSKAAIDL